MYFQFHSVHKTQLAKKKEDIGQIWQKCGSVDPKIKGCAMMVGHFSGHLCLGLEQL